MNTPTDFEDELEKITVKLKSVSYDDVLVDECITAINKLIADKIVGEDEVFTNETVHSIRQPDRKFIIQAKIRNELKAEQRKLLKVEGD